MKIPKAGELYSHKDGEVYRIVRTQLLTNTFEINNNSLTSGTVVSKHLKVKATLVWYSPTSNDMEVYVRTLPHFLDSFSDTIKQNTELEKGEWCTNCFGTGTGFDKPCLYCKGKGYL